MTRHRARVRQLSAVLLLVSIAGVAGAAAVAPARPAFAAPFCRNNAQASEKAEDVPWAQKWLAPDRVWPHTRGARVKVAVVGSGVAPTPHLGGRLVRGADLLDRTGDGRIDCAGHGTAVAAIVAGGSRPKVGFVGIAPAATVAPVRITDTETPDNSDPSQQPVSPALMATGIDAAVATGARVIVVSLVLFGDDYGKDSRGRLVGRVEAAVRRALARDIVVVAAVGDGHQLEPDPREPDSVPAKYPGVLGVGAIDEQGDRVATSQVGSYVDVVAPGGAVLAANRSGAYNTLSGTSFAAGYVGGVAALVRSASPRLPAAAVLTRLIATASPANGGVRSTGYGSGVVDPYAAVTATLVSGRPRSPEPVRPEADDPAALRAADRSAGLDAAALAAGAGLLGLVTLTTLVALIVPRARRRRWAAGRSPAPLSQSEIDEPDETFYTPPGLRTRR